MDYRNRKEVDILCSQPGKIKYRLSLLARMSIEIKASARCPLPLSQHTSLSMGLSFHSLNVMFLLCLHLPWLVEGKLVPCLFSFCRKADPASESPGPHWEERGPSHFCWTNQTPLLQTWFAWCLSGTFEHSDVLACFPRSPISFIKFLLQLEDGQPFSQSLVAAKQISLAPAEVLRHKYSFPCRIH